MNIKKPAIALVATACAVTLAGPPAAADERSKAKASEPISVLVEGLNGPRQLSAAPRGRMYAAESDTGQVSLVDPVTGGKKAVVTGLASPQGVVRVGGKLYIATGEPGPSTAPGAVPTAVMVAKPGGKPRKFADLLAYELKRNPDRQTQFDDKGEPLDTLSNPYAIIRDRHGFLLVADAGGNDVLKVSRSGKVSTLFVPPTVRTGVCKDAPNTNRSGKGCDSVPTGLAYGPGGRLYVSALTAEAPGQGRIYVINAKTGRLLRTIKGLTGPTGVAVGKNGTVYASELLEGSPEDPTNPPPGFDPATVGRIVKITRGGHRSYAQVTMPSGLLVKGGRLYASAWSIAGFLGRADAGQVVQVRAKAFR